MEEGERQTAKSSATVYTKQQQHEHYLRTLDDTRQIFQHQTTVEGTGVLTIEGNYLLVDIRDSLAVACPEAQRPFLQSWNATDNAQHVFYQSVAIAF